MKISKVGRGKLSLAIPVSRLPKFTWRDWPSILKAFEAAPALEMRQAWLKRVALNFRPGKVRLGWQRNSLFILAQLSDEDIFSNATKNNQNLWTYGDVFEIFLRDPSRPPYHELHIAPNDRWMHMRIPSTVFFKNGGFDCDLLKIAPRRFDFCLRVNQRTNRWEICARIPSSLVYEASTTLKGKSWMASFSRYDYSKNRKTPVRSSTSPHSLRSFHRQEEWSHLLFV
ncbi:MAG: carbohydrate-binding family 9-like protein [Chthoniobacterales bacterium]